MCVCARCPGARVHTCRFKDDQVFEESIETQIKAVSLIDGVWYVRLDGDLAGKVVGAVYDASAGESELVPLSLSVSVVLWGERLGKHHQHQGICAPPRTLPTDSACMCCVCDNCPQQPWEACKVKKRRTVAAGGSATMRRLLSEFSLARHNSAEAGEQVLLDAVSSAVQLAAASRMGKHSSR